MRDYEVEIDMGDGRTETTVVHGAECAEDAIRAVSAAGWKVTRRVVSRPPASITVQSAQDSGDSASAPTHVMAYTGRPMGTAVAGGSLLTREQAKQIERAVAWGTVRAAVVWFGILLACAAVFGIAAVFAFGIDSARR